MYLFLGIRQDCYKLATQILALSPGHSQILSHSCGENSIIQDLSECSTITTLAEYVTLFLRFSQCNNGVNISVVHLLLYRKLWRKLEFSPQLQDKIWEWPWNKATQILGR